ncbi:MAG: PhnD/SsuA/transferrin family substrate-binding protein, partial [Planctomycetes bacterium]|nr:PhnD/SsuA/transferrin family substrate-binding protein [Planctomycetota bacterium]
MSASENTGASEPEIRDAVRTFGADRSDEGDRLSGSWRPVAALLLAAAAVGAAWWLLAGRAPPASSLARVDLGGAHPAPAAGTGGGPAPLRVAVAAMISPKTTHGAYEGLLRHVGDRLGRPVELVQRKTYGEVNDLLERGEIDLAFVCSGPFAAGREEFGLELLAVPVVNGQKVYHGYLIVRRDSPFRSLEDLRGRTFAFTDPQSHTGTHVVTHLLGSMGETPKTFFGDAFYTYAHDNSIKAVANGMADAASVDGLIWEFIDSTSPEVTSGTRVIWRSPPYGMPPVVVRPGMAPSEKERLRALFLG